MKPKLLDLFCGAGGASMGYHRAGFDVYGVDIKPQPHYPFPFLQMDALEAMDRLIRGEGLTFSNGETLYLVDISAFHASPPCQAYVDYNKKGKKPSNHPRLIEPTRELLVTTGKPYIIENIHKAPLYSHILLCGTMFGLRTRRHRYFEAPCLPLLPVYSCNHWGTVSNGEFVGVYYRGGHGPRHGKGIREPASRPAQLTAAEGMGIDWMNQRELTQAIPPAYTEYIGKYLMETVKQPI